MRSFLLLADTLSPGLHTITAQVGGSVTTGTNIDICIGRRLCFSVVLE